MESAFSAAAMGRVRYTVDPAIRHEFAARLRAMRAYTGIGWTDLAAREFTDMDDPDRDAAIHKRADVIRKWGNKSGNDQPSDIEASNLAAWLAERSLDREGSIGLPATFLWPVPTERFSVGDRDAEAQQLFHAMRGLLDRLQGPPLDAKDA